MKSSLTPGIRLQVFDWFGALLINVYPVQRQHFLLKVPFDSGEEIRDIYSHYIAFTNAGVVEYHAVQAVARTYVKFGAVIQEEHNLRITIGHQYE